MTAEIMQIKIKLIDSFLPVPQYHTAGSVGFDLCARVDTVIKPFTPTIIPLNIVVQVPAGHAMLLLARSSLPLKKGLIVANSVGVIDQDYSGETDEVGLQVLNFTKEDVTVPKGDRIAQGLIVPVEVVEFVRVDKMSDKSRGGFGSTG